ncbi:MAG TPA: hypothetical protein VMI09_11245 [Candidatus Binataceae bacterium]|nr:hypothetical protein [Candidatus Binataceae bacterium]
MDERGTSKHMAVISSTLSVRAMRDMALRAWRSKRVFSITLLVIAVLLGARYRFHKLQRWDMNDAEGSTWAAVIAPNVCEVVRTFWQVEFGGKHPAYDLVLYEWVRAFGASLLAMRAMSALLGTIAIVLLFLAVREVSRALEGEASAEKGEIAGAFAALIFALNITLLISSRTAREFSLLIAVELLQIIFFMRAQRRGVFDDYLGLAIFTALMLPINYSASFLLLAEALWLLCLLAAKRTGAARALQLKVFRPGFAVLAGMSLLIPLLPDAYATSRAGMAWIGAKLIKPEPNSWPYTVLRDAVGESALFWIVAALIAFGVWRQWRTALLVPGFLAIWTAGPVLAAFAESHITRPIEMPRYVIIAFAGLFAFAGFGAACVRSTAIRIILAALIIAMSMRTADRLLKLKVSPNGDWRKAAAVAVKHTSPGEQIAVFAPYDLWVVQFYLPSERRIAAVQMDSNPIQTKCGTAPVLIFDQHTRAIPPQIAAIKACYPRVIASLNRIEVRVR